MNFPRPDPVQQAGHHRLQVWWKLKLRGAFDGGFGKLERNRPAASKQFIKRQSVPKHGMVKMSAVTRYVVSSDGERVFYDFGILDGHLDKPPLESREVCGVSRWD